MVTITQNPAQDYLQQLLAKQDCEGIGVRIFILDAGTPKASRPVFRFVVLEKKKSDDEVQEHGGFKAYVDAPSIPFLEEAVVDFAKDSMGGQLTIKDAGFRGCPAISARQLHLADRINYVLYNENQSGPPPPTAARRGHSGGNPCGKRCRAAHFGGGCQGCGMVDVTLKDGVEKTLLEQEVPQLTEAA